MIADSLVGRMDFFQLPILPKISIGTAGFGNEYGEMSYGECKQIIDKALLNRINYIDTSPYYGNGLSEEIVGKCLQNVSRDRYIISTSTGRYSKTKYSYRYYDIIYCVIIIQTCTGTQLVQ